MRAVATSFVATLLAALALSAQATPSQQQQIEIDHCTIMSKAVLEFAKARDQGMAKMDAYNFVTNNQAYRPGSMVDQTLQWAYDHRDENAEAVSAHFYGHCSLDALEALTPQTEEQAKTSAGLCQQQNAARPDEARICMDGRISALIAAASAPPLAPTSATAVAPHPAQSRIQTLSSSDLPVAVAPRVQAPVVAAAPQAPAPAPQLAQTQVPTATPAPMPIPAPVRAKPAVPAADSAPVPAVAKAPAPAPLEPTVVAASQPADLSAPATLAQTAPLTSVASTPVKAPEPVQVAAARPKPAAPLFPSLPAPMVSAGPKAAATAAPVVVAQAPLPVTPPPPLPLPAPHSLPAAPAPQPVVAEAPRSVPAAPAPQPVIAQAPTPVSAPAPVPVAAKASGTSSAESAMVVKSAAPSVAAGPQLAVLSPPSLNNIGKLTLGMSMYDAEHTFHSFGEEDRDEFGAETQTFLISDGHGYVVLLTEKGKPDTLYGIEYHGGADADTAPTIMGVRLGQGALAVLTHVGEPSRRERLPNSENTRWYYDGRNYAFDISSGGDLVAIRLYGYEGLQAPDPDSDAPASAPVTP